MRYRESLQAQLQERYLRLYRANWQAYRYEAGYLIEFIRSTPALKFIVDSVERAVPELDPEKWAAENFGWQRLDLPLTEDGRAKLAWHLLQHWSTEPQAVSLFGHNLDHNADLAEGARLATEQIVEPFIAYLQQQLGRSSDVLYLLERYVRRLEWFEKQRLWDCYEADRAHGEAIYDADLRKFLFDQGIDYPFSQPRSSSGEADVIAELDSDDPLVCEVKLFDGASYGKAYVGKGFRQAVQYANDYGKTTAYLVVVNLSDKQLELPTDGQSAEWPSRVDAQGVTVFLIRVRARPQPSASQQRKPDRVVISKSDLHGNETSTTSGP